MLLRFHSVSGQLDDNCQAIAWLPISSPTTGAMRFFRVLIDTGANTSGISRRVVDSLGLGDDEALSVMLNVRTVMGEIATDGFVVHTHHPARQQRSGLRPPPGIGALVSVLEMPVPGCDGLMGPQVLRHMARQVLLDFETGEFEIVWSD